MFNICKLSQKYTVFSLYFVYIMLLELQAPQDESNKVHKTAAESAFTKVNTFLSIWEAAVVCFVMPFNSQAIVFCVCVSVCVQEQVVHSSHRCSVSKSNKRVCQRGGNASNTDLLSQKILTLSHNCGLLS